MVIESGPFVLVIISAEKLGLPFLSAYLDAVGSNFSHGANFATTGSTIRPQNSTLRQSGFSPISLDVQFNEFYEFKRRSQVARGRGGVFERLLPMEDVFSRALYTFDIGQNDLTAGYFANMSTDEVRAYIPDVTITYVDVYAIKYALINHPNHFGELSPFPSFLSSSNFSPEREPEGNLHRLIR
ncbi:hypothetical protein MLD38_011895 [Melastoma candidum]|uniref:Uncharacterized protein n=1 Tax=Melastoma candidum TaxID=119954 RepID=A0ACB9R548_9MYRT|nr:hypothetical protein MLD38_011895 [Melastoma candidum]